MTRNYACFWFIFVTITSSKVKAGVSWELSTDIIHIGGSIYLTCTVDNVDSIDPNVTRQWSLGKNGDLICYNGRRKNPLKYEEILTTENIFSLKINNVTINDLSSIYECRYEFDVSKKLIKLDERKTIYPPRKDSIKVSYDREDSIVTINIHFNEVLALPNCSVEYLNESFGGFNITRYSRKGNVFDAFLGITLPCSDTKSCTREYDIRCNIGESIYYVNTTKTVNSSKDYYKGLFIGSVVIFIIVWMMIIIIYIFKYRKRPRKDKYGECPQNPTNDEKEKAVNGTLQLSNA